MQIKSIARNLVVAGWVFTAYVPHALSPVNGGPTHIGPAGSYSQQYSYTPVTVPTNGTMYTSEEECQQQASAFLTQTGEVVGDCAEVNK